MLINRYHYQNQRGSALMILYYHPKFENAAIHGSWDILSTTSGYETKKKKQQQKKNKKKMKRIRKAKTSRSEKINMRIKKKKKNNKKSKNRRSAWPCRSNKINKNKRSAWHDFQNFHIWAWNPEFGERSQSCICTLFLPQGVEIKLIFALRATVSEIGADLQNFHIWAYNLEFEERSLSCICSLSFYPRGLKMSLFLLYGQWLSRF